MHHSFDINLASQYGIEEAILIHHFQHWISYNKRRGKNLKEGKTWTFNTFKDMHAHFPYLSLQSIKYTLERLVELKIIIKRNFNKNIIDKTNWYAFEDEDLFLTSKIVYESGKPLSIAEIVPPIPDTKPNTVPVSLEKDISNDISKRTDSAVPHANSSKKEKEEKIQREEGVFTTDAQHHSLLKKAKDEESLVKRWYTRLSEWKIGKNVNRKNDYLSICRWVIEAVQEDMLKPNDDAYSKNLGFVRECKRDNLDLLYDIYVQGKWVLDKKNSSKELSLEMKPDAFVNAFMSFAGVTHG